MPSPAHPASPPPFCLAWRVWREGTVAISHAELTHQQLRGGAEASILVSSWGQDNTD